MASDTARELLCGGLAGAVGVFVGQPFDFVKIRLQAGSTLEVKLWWDLNGTFSGACARHPIEALVAHLLLISGE